METAGDEEQKQTSEKFVVLHVEDCVTGAKMKVQIKYDEPMWKLFVMVSNNLNRKVTTLRFMHEQKRIDPLDTPENMKLMNGEKLIVLTNQTGGGL
ncbi:hypothetical protein D918_04957 [Trichuris suis]|nr:hypothetical protein D918_04957 [Trichuris suis]